LLQNARHLQEGEKRQAQGREENQRELKLQNRKLQQVKLLIKDVVIPLELKHLYDDLHSRVLCPVCGNPVTAPTGSFSSLLDLADKPGFEESGNLFCRDCEQVYAYSIRINEGIDG